ncbi:unnamed protein product [Brassica oleracea]
MAPEKASQQPDMETKLESEPKPNQEPEEGDDLDPAKSIKKIRTIVETLHTLSPPQLPNLTKSRSIPPPAPSVPVGTSLNHDESENSVHKLKQGILPVGVKPEDAVKDILKEFMEKKLIEPVENKRKVKPNCYKMTPFVHSSVVLISEEIGLFSMHQKGKKPRMKHSDLKKVCLVEESSSQPEAKAKKMPAGDIETVFNVSERFPDFAFKWFSEVQPSGKKKNFSPLSKTAYKMLKVFYLGRWERTANRHIEVENPELMKYFKHMTKLKLLSFQGISRIERLDYAVCKLHDLIILDLRACYNLEKLPEKIDSLKALTYLDITDCYMIGRTPKRLSWLDSLEVLKGFVVSDATDVETFCLLSELKHLKKLRKLSITINKGGEFTVSQLFVDIQDFSSLEKLKVAWGGISEHNKAEPSAGAVKEFIRSMTRLPSSSVPEPKVHKAPKKVAAPSHLPEKLMKLDLQCFPDAELPSLLEPGKLRTLEKLYIKGGTKLTGFGKSVPEEPTECSVKVLRLKFPQAKSGVEGAEGSLLSKTGVLG